MTDVLLSPIRLSELELLIENSVQRALQKRGTTQNREEEEILDLAEAAKFLKKKEPTIYGLVAQGKIPCSKPGGKQLIFFKSDLIEWLKSSRKKTGEEIAADSESEFLNANKKRR